MTTEQLEHLKFLIRKKPLIDKWKNKALKYLLVNIAPIISKNLDYYLLEEFHTVIKELNKPYKPCVNHYEKYKNMFVSLIITEVKVFSLIREVLNKERN